jgi:N-acylneuraminate cytidylyltransferase
MNESKNRTGYATLGVILARAGSVGLANKHLLELLGRPVIDYTFDHARSATRLTRVVVSTDCPRIKLRARAAGLEVIDRPAELATGEASVQSVLLHALRTVETVDRGFFARAVVTLYGNVPVRPAGVIDEALELLEKTGCDSVRSFTPVGKWHPAWMAKLEGNRVEALQAGSIHRRQELTPLFLHDGAVVAVSRQSMLRGEATPQDPHAFFGVDRRGVAVEAGSAIEVDHRRDLYWAEAVLRDQLAGQMAMMRSAV